MDYKKLIEDIEVLRRDPSEKNAKNSLTKNIKETFGNDCIEKNYSGCSFRKPNLIVIKKDSTKLILYFHYSKEIGFFGFDKTLITEVIDYIIKNDSEKIYFYLLFVLETSDNKVKYFSVPIFFIKNFEMDISISDYKGTISPQYKFLLDLINGKYKLKLKNKRYEDISNFETDIEGLFNENFMKIHDEEKIKYYDVIKAKQELTTKLVGS